MNKFIKKFNKFLKESAEWEVSIPQITELLTDITDEFKGKEIVLKHHSFKKFSFIRLYYKFKRPITTEDANIEYSVMDDIVDKLTDCGYIVKYIGFWASYTLDSKDGSMYYVFCDIYEGEGSKLLESSSIETSDGFIIHGEDIEDIFSEYIEDVPQLKDAKIYFTLGGNRNLKPDNHSGQIDFTVTFFLKVNTPQDNETYPPEKQWFNRFFGHLFIKHDHLFKKDIINRIDDRVYDQFGYHLIKMDKSGGDGFWIDFCFGKNRKLDAPYFRNIDVDKGNGRYGNPQ